MKYCLIAILVTLMLVACDSDNCQLGGVVTINFKLSGEEPILKDTLTIYTTTAQAKDTILLNKSVNTKEFSLPMSYTQKEDSYFIIRTNKEGFSIKDTIKIKKENIPHFESVECPITYFHKIQEIKTTYNSIQNIELKNTMVDYNATNKHIIIAFETFSN